MQDLKVQTLQKQVVTLKKAATAARSAKASTVCKKVIVTGGHQGPRPGRACAKKAISARPLTKAIRTVTLKLEVNDNIKMNDSTLEEGEIPHLEDGEIPPSVLEDGEIPDEETAMQTGLPESPMVMSTPKAPKRTPSMDPKEKVSRWIENGIGTNI